MTRTGKVYLIGAGPGDPELMTIKATRMLGEADAVVYDRLVSDEILATLPAGLRLVPVGKSPGNHSVPQDRINEILFELASAGMTVARLGTSLMSRSTSHSSLRRSSSSRSW